MSEAVGFNIPCLIITYKRHDTTLKVLESVKKVKAKNIYISSNHWKNNEEREVILSLREKIKKYINWECKVTWIIKTKHLSARESGLSAIDEFFNKEEWGIILEDDIVPNESFFFYCKEMLLKYKDNSNIFTISGWSALDFNQTSKQTLKEDYFFSKYSHIWGWATWRRAWQFHKGKITNFEQEFLKFKFDTTEEKKTWYRIFHLTMEGKIDTWDHLWTYTIWKEEGLCIYPKNNMIKNIGFNRSDATNTKQQSKYDNMRTYKLSFPLKHPAKIKRNILLDKQNFIITMKDAPFWLIIINKINRIIFKKNLKNFKNYLR